VGIRASTNTLWKPPSSELILSSVTITLITILFAIISATAATANALPITTLSPFSAETLQEFGRLMAKDNSKVGFKKGMG